MKNFLKELFKSEPKDENRHFKIVHFPLSGKYYPQYKGYWLQKVYTTGVIRTEDFFPVVDGFKTEAEVRKFIELFKEHQLHKNIEIINV